MTQMQFALLSQVNHGGATIACTIPEGVKPGQKFAIEVAVPQGIPAALPAGGGAGTLEVLPVEILQRTFLD